MVTGLEDGRIRVWSRDGAVDPVDLPGHAAAVDALAFHPGGDSLVSADRAGHLYVWPWSDAAIAEQLRVATVVCLTPGQRQGLLNESPEAAQQATTECTARHAAP